MTRWLVAVVAALIAVLAGYLLFLNPESVSVRLTPTWTMDAPLAGALLVAFATGALLVGFIAAARASARRRRSARRCSPRPTCTRATSRTRGAPSRRRS